MERDTRLLVDLLRDRQLVDRSLGQHYLIDDNILETSIEMAGDSPSIKSTSGFSIIDRNCLAYADKDST